MLQFPRIKIQTWRPTSGPAPPAQPTIANPTRLPAAPAIYGSGLALRLLPWLVPWITFVFCSLPSWKIQYSNGSKYISNSLNISVNITKNHNGLAPEENHLPPVPTMMMTMKKISMRLQNIKITIPSQFHWWNPGWWFWGRHKEKATKFAIAIKLLGM